MPSGRHRVGRPLHVALIGCGQIADAHLQEVRRMPAADLVAVCDRHADLAWQAAARFAVPRHFTDLGQLFDTVPVDVLHITTPPESHLPIALHAFERGAHVYVEKPVALNVRDARTMIEAAECRGRLLCAGHDQLWDPAWIAFRTRIGRGEIGRVVHVEAFQRYDLSGSFGRRVTADPDHWVRALDGGLLQNALPHAIYRLASFLPAGDMPSVRASWFRRGADFPTDLHAHFRTPELSATLTFITGAHPSGSVFRAHGTSGTLQLDCTTQQIHARGVCRMPELVTRIAAPAGDARDAFGDLLRAAHRVLRGDLRYFAGMGGLFAAFYETIRASAPPPVPYGDVMRTMMLSDHLFHVCRAEPDLACAPS